MRKLLISIFSAQFFTSMCLAQGEYQSHLLPFSECEECPTGYMTEEGDTVWQAVFTDINWMHFPISSGWAEFCIARKDRMYGVISLKGDVLLPFKFYDVKPTFNRSFAALIETDKEYGYAIYDEFGNQLRDHIYEEYQVDEHNKYVLASIEGNYGILDTMNQEIIAFKYQSVEFQTCIESDSYIEYRFPHFVLSRDRKGTRIDGMGIANFDGDIIIEPNYKRIFPRIRNPLCEDFELFFEVENLDEKCGILNDQGDVVVPFEYLFKDLHLAFSKAPYGFFGYRNCDPEVVGYCLIDEGEFKSAINVRNGEKRSGFDHLSMIGKYLIYRNGEEEGVMDENFDILYSSFSKSLTVNPHMLVAEFPKEKYRVYDERDEEWKVDYSKLSGFDNVLYYGSTDSKIGLFNYVKNVSSAQIYDSIIVHRGDDKNVYWAFRSAANPIQSEAYEVDILDLNLKVTRTIEVGNGKIQMPLKHTYQKELKNRIVIVENNAGKYGALNLFGDTIIPVQNERFYYMSREIIPNNDSIYQYCSFGTKDSIGLYFSDGTNLIPPIYVGFHRKHLPFQFYQCFNSEGITDIYNAGFERIQNDCQAVFAKFKLNQYGHSESTRRGSYSLEDRNEMRLYSIKNEHLYFYEIGTWILVDEKLLKFKTDSMIVFDQCKIDRSGKVLNMHEYELGKYSKTRN